MASPQLEMIIQLLRSRPAIVDFDVVRLRQGLEALVGTSPVPEGVACTPLRVADVPCEWIVADGARDDAVLLYLHGGGYCIGSINTHRALVSRLSAATAMRGLAVDYRLAPEHPFPAALDDATAVYRWLLGQGVAPERVVVAGDSAGGGLTLATLLATRDAQLPRPAGGVCLSPWTDLEVTGATMDSHAERDPMIRRDGALRLAAAYLGAAPARTPLASPLHADLRGLPPLLVQVGTAETLLDDSVRLAERARAADVDVTLEPWEDMIHVWQAFAPLLPEADEAIAAIGSWVRARVP
ncbi:MAG: alpha/beta hydrolase [bacterium]|nr:alpha/beta hydrolase [bacterium]